MSPLHFVVSVAGNWYVIPHFRVREFAQKGCDVVTLDRVALMALSNFRQWLGAPVRVTSGFRTKSHNATVGGVPNSLHLAGAAFDLVWDSAPKGDYEDPLRAAGFTEVIDYPGSHWHVGVKHGV